MSRLVFYVDRNSLPDKQVRGEISIWLYGGQSPAPHIGTIGAQALDAAAHLGVVPSVAAMDFLSIAMAVTAADTFVMREDEADGWSRSFEIVLPLVDVARWTSLRPALESALRFLSGDKWSFEFVAGGVRPPLKSQIRRKIPYIDISKADCVCLFSGGLDSAIGAAELIAAQHRPLLVSHSARGESAYQDKVAAALPAACERLAINPYPTLKGVDDDTMRTRSFMFLALGALAAQARAALSGGTVSLFVCENGQIAINPPLTPRRIGSHSTRTAHPAFLSAVADIVATAGLPVSIQNPYDRITKGEMVARNAARTGFADFVASTVSCGKWKRKGQQCGRCVPCLIRRASLYAAAVDDNTDYRFPDLSQVMKDVDGRDDLVAVQRAIRRPASELTRWVLQAGPLPHDPAVRAAYIDVVRRGLAELATYLSDAGVPA